jgi:outer membrane protein assembly factor BamB
LNPSTAAGLRQVWASHADSIVTGQPVIGNGLVYWGAFDGYERASDPSGKTVWSTFLGKTVTAPQPLPDCLGGDVGITGTATLITVPGGAVLYVAGGDASFYALNAATGAIVWKTSLGVQPNQFLWSSPLFYGGSVYEGVASFQECPAVQGQVVQMDGGTGAIQHVWKAVPDGCTGGPVSSSAALDAVTGTIFIATGSSPGSCDVPGDTAMVALRASDLSLVGSWKIPVSDQSPDSDWLATPMLFRGNTKNIGGLLLPQDLVGIENKNGIYYAFDRSNISAGPVWSTRVGASGDCPICGPPGAAIAPSAWDGATIYVGGNQTTINSATCYGSVRALDPATGAAKWEKCLGAIVLGAISISQGLVVVGAGPDLYVLSAATGATLFTFHDGNPGPPPVGGTADFWGTAAIGQGVIYIGNIDGNMFAFSV